MIYLDLETRSSVNLGAKGSYLYACDPSTRVLCVSYAIDDEPVAHIWEPALADFEHLLYPLLEEGHVIVAHNAEFEYTVLNYAVGLDLDPEDFLCTQALAQSMGAPGGLDKLSRYLGISGGKHKEGMRLINTYSITYHPLYQEHVPPEDKALMLAYCDQDVELTREIKARLPQEQPMQVRDWPVHVRINERGVPCDTQLCEEATGYAEEVRHTADARIAQITEGQVAGHSKRKSRDKWLRDNLGYESHITPLLNDNGAISFDQQKRDVLANGLPDDHVVSAFINQVNAAGGATTKKYRSMVQSATEDKRIQGVFAFNAAHTGRFSSRRCQLHNMKRNTPKELNDWCEQVREGYELDGDVNSKLASIVRGAIHEPNDGLTWGDWSNIEGRVLPWVSDSDGGREKLEIFASGGDVYKSTASGMLEKPVTSITKDERQVGKVAELSCGYGGSTGAVMRFSVTFGLNFDHDFAASVVAQWRRANPWAVTLWGELERAAMHATTREGHIFTAGRTKWLRQNDFLMCMLPSGRCLGYYKPVVEEARRGYALTCANGSALPKAGEDTWPMKRLWGGLIAENVAQAIAADILRDALWALDREGLPTVGHVHDEIIMTGDHRTKLEAVMQQGPTWAEGLPLAAEVDYGSRYGK